MTPRVFVVVALVIGLAYVFVTPPFAVPDEDNHLWRSYAIGRGHFVSAGGLDSRSFSKALQNFVWTIERNQPRETMLQKLQAAAAIKYDKTRGKPIRFASIYTPVPYALTSIVTRIPLRPILVFYCGRLANLFAVITLLALALRAAPRYASFVAAAVLLPTSLYESASWSADAATISLAGLFTVLLLEPPKRTWIVAVVGGALALCKPVYFLIALLVLVRPFRLRERVTVLLATAVGTAASFVVAHRGAYDVRPGLPVDPAAQLRCIAASPFHFARVLILDMAANGYSYFHDMIGILGRNEFKVPNIVVFVEIALLALVAITSGLVLNARVRIGALTISILTVVGIFTLEYLIGSIVCGDVIDGVQGRYLLEIVPLSLIAISVPGRSWRHTPAVIVIVAGACNSVALFILVHRFW